MDDVNVDFKAFLELNKDKIYRIAEDNAKRDSNGNILWDEED